jgi:hypothetical protein
VQFSDFYIKPNYSAHLTQVAGTVSALSARRPETCSCRPRREHRTVRDTRDAESVRARALTRSRPGLRHRPPPLTSYSGKYAGYGITKGALSFKSITDRQAPVDGINQLVLDQLTFGEHVDSPSATKLPILLAVARSRMATAPSVSICRSRVRSTIPSSRSGCRRADHRQPDHEGGDRAIRAAGCNRRRSRRGSRSSVRTRSRGHFAVREAKLQTLAKALTDRPALKLDVAGRAPADVDREGRSASRSIARSVRKQKCWWPRAIGAVARRADDRTGRVSDHLTVASMTTRSCPTSRAMPSASPKTAGDMESLLLASYGVDDGRCARWPAPGGIGQVVRGKGRHRVGAHVRGRAEAHCRWHQDTGAPTRVDFAIRWTTGMRRAVTPGDF